MVYTDVKTAWKSESLREQAIGIINFKKQKKKFFINEKKVKWKYKNLLYL